MPSLNLAWLIPVLGGYWLLTQLHWTRYWIAYHSGHRLYFSAAIVGILLLGIGRWIVVGVNGRFPEIQACWGKFAPFDHSGAILFSVLLSIAIPPIINLFKKRQDCATKAASDNGDLMESLFEKSLELGGKMLVEITLRSGKSYVGFPRDTGARTTHREADISLVPLVSGYRNDSRQLVMTTHYATALVKCQQTPGYKSGLVQDDFKVILPLREIESARRFDLEAYKLIQQRSPQPANVIRQKSSYIGAAKPSE